MNNKAELQKKLADLKAEIEQTEKLLSEPEVPTIDELVELYQPKWYFNIINGDMVFRGDAKIIGYMSERHAKIAELRRQFDLIAHHCNGGWKWDGKSRFHSVRYNYADRDSKFDVYSSMSGLITSGEILFKSYEAATLAIKIFGQDNLKKMNGIS